MRGCATRRWFAGAVWLVLLSLAACGGGGGGGGGSSGTPRTRFTWRGTVTSIVNVDGNPVSVPGISVGDQFVATVVYDPATFGAGQAVTSDGLDYPAPAGLQMQYLFESGAQFSESITDVRIRDASTVDTWNWDGGDFGGLLFQASDPGGASFAPPLPSSFAAAHTLFVAALASFEPADGNQLVLFPSNLRSRRVISFEGQSFSITSE